MNKNRTIILLASTNILTLLFIVMLTAHFNLHKKVLLRFGLYTKPVEAEESKGKRYDYLRSMFDVYHPKEAKVVVLGDSISERADWNQLLSRTDIVNRSISTDTVEGFLTRLPDVYALNPDYCLMMGGINDILSGTPVDEIMNNFVRIVEILRAHKITPVFQSTLYVSTEVLQWEENNRQVDELNRRLKEYAATEKIEFIDVNKGLSENGALNPKYSYDGVHLVAAGYAKWREMLPVKKIMGV